MWKRRTLTLIISEQTQQSRQIAQRAKHRPRYESTRRKFNRMIGSALSLSRRSLVISHKTKKGRSMKKMIRSKNGRERERERERMREGGRGRERERGCFRIPNGQEHHTINRLEREERQREGWVGSNHFEAEQETE